MDRPLRAARLAAAARRRGHAGDGGRRAEDHRAPGRHSRSRRPPRWPVAGRGAGTARGAGRDDVLRRGGRRDVLGDGSAGRPAARPTTTTPGCSGPGTTCGSSAARGSARRSGSWSDPEGQPQLSQTPVAGMAMLQVGQTCASTCGWVADAPARDRARPATCGVSVGLPPSVGNVRAEGAVARQPLGRGVVVGVADQLAAHRDDGLDVAGSRRFRSLDAQCGQQRLVAVRADPRHPRRARRRPSSGRAGWSGCRSAAAPARPAPGRSPGAL